MLFLVILGIQIPQIVIATSRVHHLHHQNDQAKELYLLEKRNLQEEEDLQVMRKKALSHLMMKLGGNVEIEIIELIYFVVVF